MIIGHAQSMSREAFIGDGAGGAVPRLIAGTIALLFPDFKSFDVIDAVVTGVTVPAAALWQMGGLTVIYLTIYMMAAWIIFAGKEL
jgi:hypothetical protein